MDNKKIIDFRSDTVTKPTDEMRDAMKNANVGDDVYRDDPDVIALEELAASMLGKEAALFVPSGTFGNQLALFTWCNKGDEVILGDSCHIIAHEAGAGSVIAGVQFRTIDGIDGRLPIGDIERKIRKAPDIHEPATKLICLENALANGMVLPLDYMEEVHSLAKKYNLPIHLDGARIFNAAAALGTEASEIARHVDSVMFCLSKGLCAPVGSMLAGSKEFVEKAVKLRKLMGGGLRQAGVLAAPGIIALKKMTKRLHEDHKNAKLLSELLSEIKGVNVLKENTQINMVFFSCEGLGCTDRHFVKELKKRNIIINGEENGLYRFVTHYWTNEEDVRYAAAAVKEVLGFAYN